MAEQAVDLGSASANKPLDGREVPATHASNTTIQVDNNENQKSNENQAENPMVTIPVDLNADVVANDVDMPPFEINIVSASSEPETVGVVLPLVCGIIVSVCDRLILRSKALFVFVKKLDLWFFHFKTFISASKRWTNKLEYVIFFAQFFFMSISMLFVEY